VYYRHPSLQDYRNRDSNTHKLDERWFDALNDGAALGDGMTLMVSGCLDALDLLPAGAHRSEVIRWSKHEDRQGLIYPVVYERGITLEEVQEREAFIESILNPRRST
jgi:hypothetical protein